MLNTPTKCYIHNQGMLKQHLKLRILSNCSVSEIFHQIQENQINGHENITVQQTYHWWSIESHKTYCRDPDPLLSAKYLLEEFNQEIILDSLNTSIPALGFLTALFYQLLYNKFDAIEIDATYNTNYNKVLYFFNFLFMKMLIFRLNKSRNKPKWHLWLKNICSNFNSLEKMNKDIIALENRKTMSRTWKYFNKNTRYWE